MTLSGLRNGLFKFQVLRYWFQSAAFPKSIISKIALSQLLPSHLGFIWALYSNLKPFSKMTRRGFYRGIDSTSCIGNSIYSPVYEKTLIFQFGGGRFRFIQSSYSFFWRNKPQKGQSHQKITMLTAKLVTQIINSILSGSNVDRQKFLKMCGRVCTRDLK